MTYWSCLIISLRHPLVKDFLFSNLKKENNIPKVALNPVYLNKITILYDVYSHNLPKRSGEESGSLFKIEISGPQN